PSSHLCAEFVPCTVRTRRDSANSGPVATGARRRRRGVGCAARPIRRSFLAAPARPAIAARPPPRPARGRGRSLVGVGPAEFAPADTCELDGECELDGARELAP